MALFRKDLLIDKGNCNTLIKVLPFQLFFKGNFINIGSNFKYTFKCVQRDQNNKRLKERQ